MRLDFFKILIVILSVFPTTTKAQVNVSPSKDYLVESKTGKPFFWLGDTAWELFHRLTHEDIIYYLDKRKEQGFNVIQAVALAELNGLRTPNRYGDLPFHDGNPLDWDTTPGNDPNDSLQYDYWDHVDFAVNEAAKRGLYIGLLPTWGDKVAHYFWGDGPIIFNEDNAYPYAKKLAEHFKDNWNIIWILGGDRPAVYENNGVKYDDRPIWRAMAKGIRDVYGDDVFITYHPGGDFYGSSEYIQTEPWLKMNGIQSGHGSRTVPIWNFIAQDLAKKPQKPTMDLEPCYEDHPVNPWDGKWTRKGRGFFSDYDVRARMYRGVFAGGCGSTYGHYAVWQLLDTTLYAPVSRDTIIHWKQALDAKAAGHIRYLKKLMETYPDFDREEDSLMVLSPRGTNYKDLIIATRNKNKTYAMVYLPQPLSVSIDINRLKPGKKTATWFNPVTGEFIPVREKKIKREQFFTPVDTNQQDWVLVITTEE